jgi:hypothetical protein
LQPSPPSSWSSSAGQLHQRAQASDTLGGGHRPSDCRTRLSTDVVRQSRCSCARANKLASWARQALCSLFAVGTTDAFKDVVGDFKKRERVDSGMIKLCTSAQSTAV